MTFTRLGAVVAWLGALMAVARIGISIYALTLADDAAKQFSSRYLGTTNIGAALDQAGLVLAFAVALGVLVEISRALNRKQ